MAQEEDEGLNDSTPYFQFTHEAVTINSELAAVSGTLRVTMNYNDADERVA